MLGIAHHNLPLSSRRYTPRRLYFARLQIKSLSDSGLGRLTALTKLSVSHNTLVDLPDLSACR